MKKIGKKKTLLLISAIMILCLSACGGQGKDAPSKLQGNEFDPTVISKEEREIPVDETKGTKENTEISAEIENSGVNKEK